MTKDDALVSNAQASIAQSLALIAKTHPVAADPATPPIPLGQLYDQCQALATEVARRPPEPIRTIHHFACTGGTLISKFLAATPNACLLSEVDPLSPVPTLVFSPSDLPLLYRNVARPVPEHLVEEVFMAGLATLYAQIIARGERLILRDHAHSVFCTDPIRPDRKTLAELLVPSYALKSVVTVRHPLDSFMSAHANKWLYFSPPTLEEYAKRYHAFLDRYAECAIVSYEGFVADPEASAQTLCSLLDLPYVPNLGTHAQTITLTGDSGRSSPEISPRPRRDIPQQIAQMRTKSPAYDRLCARLDYEP